ncbi:hypothetical protein H0H93_004077 [Arthromyces matolae]|nr:hypothetical protein H0H93_004077 [Arthromyces matolae]
MRNFCWLAALNHSHSPLLQHAGDIDNAHVLLERKPAAVSRGHAGNIDNTRISIEHTCARVRDHFLLLAASLFDRSGDIKMPRILLEHSIPLPAEFARR